MMVFMCLSALKRAPFYSSYFSTPGVVPDTWSLHRRIFDEHIKILHETNPTNPFDGNYYLMESDDLCLNFHAT